MTGLWHDEVLRRAFLLADGRVRIAFDGHQAVYMLPEQRLDEPDGLLGVLLYEGLIQFYRFTFLDERKKIAHFVLQSII